MKRLGPAVLLISIFVLSLVLSGCGLQSSVTHTCASRSKVESIKAGEFDTGKMWTFDFPPSDYFAKTYSFTPSKEWFEKARLAALRLPNCSASFVSEDGLVMTNHHCARGALDEVTKEGERLAEEGFYASTLEEERKVPNLYIDQLFLIEDVTDEVQQAFDSGKDENEKMANRAAKIFEIQQRYTSQYKETMPNDSLVFSVVSFYNGGKFSVYGYKRYTDIRLVYAPEEEVAFFGGDPDNFTYPRYDFDCAFFRVYENGKPLKTSNFFRFSQTGAQEGEAVFIIGNPGRTSRLQTVAQLQFLRDYAYPALIETYKTVAGIYTEYVKKYPEEKIKHMNTIFSFENSRKAITGYLSGLEDPVVMAKKVDFENSLKSAIQSNPILRKKYGDPWKTIAKNQQQYNELYSKLNALSFRGRTRSQIFTIATDVLEYARAMNLPEEQRQPKYKGTELDSTKAKIFPKNFTPELEQELLAYQLEVMVRTFGTSNKALNELLRNRTPRQAAADLMQSSALASKEKTLALLSQQPSEIVNSNDPILVFVREIQPYVAELRQKAQGIQDEIQANSQILGRALYDVYGTKIPPDATFTLRISDGIVKGYEYNGTLAPAYTTFYGMYDRYYSFQKRDPWNLPARWVNPPASFNLSTPFNFVSTCDIIGGNSGSPVINKNLEVVGLVFDGNIESLPGDVIFDDTKNRAVSVHTAGILEALEKLYNAQRIVKELKQGKISE
ncbi:MAG: S46 family peptidase [Bacteroidetes bacterium]|nr:S46 family peptidase [Bacteroidota bacterium]